MFVDQSTMQISGAYSGSSAGTLSSLTYTFVAETILTYVQISLGNSAAIASGSTLTIKLTKILMPPSLAPVSGIVVFTGDAGFYYIEYADFATLVNSLPGTQSSTIYKSSATMLGVNGVLQRDQSYQFAVYLSNDVPMNGYVTLTIPTSVGWPVGCELTCISHCVTSDVTVVLNPSLRLITLQGLVPEESKYILAPGPLVFSLSGFTNPATTEAVFFGFNSYAVLSSPAGTWLVDSISSMFIQAQQGTCIIYTFAPTDGNYMIYGVAASWTVTLACDHAILTDYSIKILIPSDFYVISTSSCVVGGQQLGYSCVASNPQGSITISSFTKTIISARTKWTFTVNAIRNPAVIGKAALVIVHLRSSSGGIIDLGNYTISNKLITTGAVLQFTVTPENKGVGMFPVMYDFKVQPSGEFPAGSFLVITLPDGLSIYKPTELEKQCSYNLTGFTSARINCKVSGNVVTINTGFQFAATTAMTVSMVPPIVTFSLPQFWNPRNTKVSSAFGLSIYSSSSVKLYEWNNTYAPSINGQTTTVVSAGPVVQMLTAAAPQKISISRSSLVNGAVTDLNITVQTTNSLVEGDSVQIQLPPFVFFSTNTQCIGASQNLRFNQTCTVAHNQSSVAISLLLPLSFRRLQGSTARIQAGQAFTLTLTQVKNQGSFAPTQSLKYFVYNQDSLIETQSTGLVLQNTVAGQLDPVSAFVIPSDFRKSVNANYTVTFTPLNYLQNMVILIQLPAEVRMVAAVACFDADSKELTCSSDLNKQRVNITDAFSTQFGNPGTLSVLLSSLQNPTGSIETNSFAISTFSEEGFQLDELSTLLSVNFYCTFPCRKCTQPTRCTQCYSDFKVFDQSCVKQCPDGYFPQNDTCKQCQRPCATCDGPVCLTCEADFMLQVDKCVQTVYWPFPFVFAGLFLMCSCFCCDLMTCKTSRYKELFIAMLAFPEIGSWVAFCVFTWQKGPLLTGSLGLTQSFEDSSLIAFVLGSAAFMFYMCMNLVHACMLPSIYRDGLQSYRDLKPTYTCSTCLAKLAGCFSFKFSMILVSHMHERPRFGGDYSDRNWRVFGRFCLVFVCIPYPVMVFACAYFLYANTLFCYAGFAAVEVIAISTVTSSLLFFDAVQSLRCHSKPVRPALKGEVEEEEMTIAKRVRRPKGVEEFGNDDSISRYPFVLSERQTRQQLQMLGELAISAREQREQLRLEAERITRDMQHKQQSQLELLQRADSDQQIKSDYSSSHEARSYFDFEKELETEVQDHHVASTPAWFEEIVITSQLASIRIGVTEALIETQQLTSQLECVTIGVTEDLVDTQQQQFKSLQQRTAEANTMFTATAEQSPASNEERVPIVVPALFSSFERTQSLSELQVALLNPQFSLVSLYEEALRSQRSAIRQQSLQSSLHSQFPIPETNSSLKHTDPIKHGSKSLEQQVKHRSRTPPIGAKKQLSLDSGADVLGGISIADQLQQVVAFENFSQESKTIAKSRKSVEMVGQQDKHINVPIFMADQNMMSNYKSQDLLAQKSELYDMAHSVTQIGQANLKHTLRSRDSIPILAAGKSATKFLHQDQTLPNISATEAKRLHGLPISSDRNSERVQKDIWGTNGLGLDDWKRSSSEQDGQTPEAMSLASQQEKQQLFIDHHRPQHQRASLGESSIAFQKSLNQETSFEVKNKSLDQYYSNVLVGNEQSQDMEGAKPNTTNQSLQELARPKQSAHQQPNFKVSPNLNESDMSSEGVIDHRTFRQHRRNKAEQASAESSEGVMDHSQVFPKAHKQVSRTLVKNPSHVNKSKPVLYSDKSESSIDEMMGDTPSNYNIANGRLDGKSQGLKAHLLLANQVQKILEPSLLSLPAKTSVNLDQSRDGGWGILNQPISAVVQVLESADESMVSNKPKKKAIKTNKQFAEILISRNVVGKSQALPSSHDKQTVKKNNFL